MYRCPFERGAINISDEGSDNKISSGREFYLLLPDTSITRLSSTLSVHSRVAIIFFRHSTATCDMAAAAAFKTSKYKQNSILLLLDFNVVWYYACCLASGDGAPSKGSVVTRFTFHRTEDLGSLLKF